MRMLDVVLRDALEQKKAPSFSSKTRRPLLEGVMCGQSGHPKKEKEIMLSDCPFTNFRNAILTHDPTTWERETG